MKGFIKAIILLACTIGIIVLGKYLLTDQPYFDTKYDEFLHTDDEGIQIEAVDPQTVLDEMGFYTMEWAGVEKPYYLYLYIVDFEPYKYAMMYEPADVDGYTGEMSVYCSRIDDRIVFQFGEKRYVKAKKTEKTAQTMSPIYVQNCYEQILEYMNTSGYSDLKWFEIKIEKGGATVGWNNEDRSVREYIEFEVYEKEDNVLVIFSNKQRKEL